MTIAYLPVGVFVGFVSGLGSVLRVLRLLSCALLPPMVLTCLPESTGLGDGTQANVPAPWGRFGASFHRVVFELEFRIGVRALFVLFVLFFFRFLCFGYCVFSVVCSGVCLCIVSVFYLGLFRCLVLCSRRVWSRYPAVMLCSCQGMWSFV